MAIAADQRSAILSHKIFFHRMSSRLAFVTNQVDTRQTRRVQKVQLVERKVPVSHY